MTPRQIIIKALDEETELTCRKARCNKAWKEGYCHKCSLEILREYDRKISNKVINDFQEWLKTQVVGIDNKTKEILVVVGDRWELAIDKFEENKL